MKAIGNREIELKLRTSAHDLAQIRQSLLAIGRYNRTPETKTLISTYFDTADKSLLAKKLALRVRRDGDRYIQTVKGPAPINALLSDRPESECEIGDDRPNIDCIPDAALRRQVANLTRGCALTPLFATRVTRTVGRLRTDRGDDIEMAFDEGVIDANGDTELINEIELELVDGRPAGLFEFAQQLSAVGVITPTLSTKADRGIALATGVRQKAFFADPLSFKRKIRLSKLINGVLRNCAHHVAANEPATIAYHDGPALHQMRVGLRRLRVAFRLFRSVMDEYNIGQIEQDAKWLGEVLGRARDCDVFVKNLGAQLCDIYGDDPAIDGFIRAAEAQRIEAWKTADLALRSARYGQFVLALSVMIENKSWRRSHDEIAMARLSKRASRVLKPLLSKRLKKIAAMSHNIDGLSRLERHALRKELKKLRYAADFSRSLFDEVKARRFLKRLRSLQDVIGDVNDATAARSIVERMVDRGVNASGGMAWAGGLLVGRQDHAAEVSWAHAKELYNDFAVVKPFWK